MARKATIAATQVKAEVAKQGFTLLNATPFYDTDAFAVTNAKLSTAPTSQTAITFAYPGASPVVSSNGTSNAIVWAHENSSPAVLHAYDAADLTHELYRSHLVRRELEMTKPLHISWGRHLSSVQITAWCILEIQSRLCHSHHKAIVTSIQNISSPPITRRCLWL